MVKRETYLLWGLFVIVLVTRLALSFFTPNFTYESYFHLQQVEQIGATGFPNFEGSLFLPLFHYLATALSLIIPLDILAKILPNLLYSSLILIIYLIAKSITDNPKAALFSALIAGFLPVLFSTNAFEVEALFFPLIFLAIYTFLNIQKKKYVYLYLLAFLLLSLTSSATSLLIIGFILYLILAKIEKKEISSAELELILFSIFFFLWIQFLFFKNMFSNEGINFIWQNIPTAIISQYFPKVSILEALALVSIIPLLVGLYTIYRSLFQAQNKETFLLITLALSTAVFTWFRLIPFKVALSFFGIILAILFALFYQDIWRYFVQTKIAKFKRYFPAIITLLLIITIIPTSIQISLDQVTPSDEEIAAFQWLQNNTPKNAGVAALLEESNLVSYYSRNNLLDTQFGAVKDVDERFASLNAVFNTAFQTQVLRIADKYDLQYIIFTTHAQERYNITKPRYYPGECFKRVYYNATQIYQIKCTLEEIKPER